VRFASCGEVVCCSHFVPAQGVSMRLRGVIRGLGGVVEATARPGEHHHRHNARTDQGGGVSRQHLAAVQSHRGKRHQKRQ